MSAARELALLISYLIARVHAVTLIEQCSLDVALDRVWRAHRYTVRMSAADTKRILDTGDRLLGRLGLDNCLRRSFGRIAVAARVGRRISLVIGASLAPGGDVVAHAWTESDFMPADPDAHKYREIYRWSSPLEPE